MPLVISQIRHPDSTGALNADSLFIQHTGKGQ